MKELVIEKEDLKHNSNKIKEFAKTNGPDDEGNDVKIIAVVKANAYGLGMVEFTKFLIDQGFDYFGVATVEEAITLREAGINHQILMLSSIANWDEIELLINHNIMLTIGSSEVAKRVDKVAEKLNKKVKAHVEIDTGFGRYGFLYNKREDMVEELSKLQHVKIEGTYSHFSISFYDKKYTKLQFERFLDCIEVLKMNDIPTGMLHICNSSAFFNYPEMHLNAVRIGSAFSGRLSFSQLMRPTGLKKIGCLTTEVAEIKHLPKGFNVSYSNAFETKKPTTIAVIPCGYMDGFNIKKGTDMFRPIDRLRYIVRDIKQAVKRSKISVMIASQRCEVIGSIGTYHIIADVTGKDIAVGDEVVLEVNPSFVPNEIRREYRV